MKRRAFLRSLGGRIVVVSVVLLLALQGVSLLLTRVGIERNARRQLDASLGRAEVLLREQLDQRGTLLQAAAATVGADYGLLSTLQGEVDAETVRSTLEDKLGRLRPAQVAAVLDRRGQIVAALGADAPGLVRLAAEQPDWQAREARLATVAGHYLTWDEATRGPLAPGMAADFVVLDEDPLTCELDRIRDIAVRRTFVAGREVYAR